MPAPAVREDPSILVRTTGDARPPVRGPLVGVHCEACLAPIPNSPAHADAAVQARSALLSRPTVGPPSPLERGPGATRVVFHSETDPWLKGLAGSGRGATDLSTRVR